MSETAQAKETQQPAAPTTFKLAVCTFSSEVPVTAIVDSVTVDAENPAAVYIDFKTTVGRIAFKDVPLETPEGISVADYGLSAGQLVGETIVIDTSTRLCTNVKADKVVEAKPAKRGSTPGPNHAIACA